MTESVLARRLLSFVSNTLAYGTGMLLLALVALFMIPSMVRNSGPDAWSGIASGQAIGAIAATVIGYGWGLTGPADVVASPPHHWRRLFYDSLRLKFTIFLPATSLATVMAYATNADFGSYAVLGAISAGLVGLSSEWFYIGMNKPWWIFGLEVIPRVIGGTLGIAGMETGRADARDAVLCQIGGMVVGQTLAATFLLLRFLKGTQSEPSTPLKQLFRSHRNGVASQVVATGYMALPIVIVSTVAPLALATFAVLDKAQKQIVTVVQPGVTALQALTPDRDNRRLAANARVGAWVGLGISTLLFTILLLVGPTFLRWLGAGQIPFDFLQVALISLNAAMVLMDSVVGRGILPALRRVDVVARANAVGATIGLAAVLVLALIGGATGALVGFGIGVLIRLTWQSRTLFSEVRRLQNTHRAPQPASVVSPPDGLA